MSVAVTGEEFVAIMSAFPTGVAIVTAVDVDGTPRGLTTNAVTSAVTGAADPARLPRPHLTHASGRPPQRPLRRQLHERRLRGRSAGSSRPRPTTSSSACSGCPASAECLCSPGTPWQSPSARSRTSSEVGDHAVVTGLVEGGSPPESTSEPLLYFRPRLPRGRAVELERIRRVPPFRIGVMQLTMEPLEEMLASARVMDEVGMDTIWLAEAYPWWRKHGMEARSSTVVSALIARETERLTIGWGIISPFTRHPVQVAMDARVVQEAAGPGRFLLGFGTSKIFLNNAKRSDEKVDARADARRGRDHARSARRRARSTTRAGTWSASVPALEDGGATRRVRSRPCTSPRRRRRCRRSRARSATAA